MTFDFKKEFKEFYMPKNTPEIVTVPRANYIAVRGKGNPNEEGGEYRQAIGMSDTRKVAPEKWKTVIRHPICKF